MNKILLSNDIKKIIEFSYFISGFIYVLNTYSKEVRCKFINDRDKLYVRKKLSLEDLIKLDSISIDPKEENRIITFKTFLKNVSSLMHSNGIIHSLLMDFKNYFDLSNSDRYDTKIYIEHHFSNGWETSCFSIPSQLNYKIFNLFTFFKVNEVKINFENKCAEIKLELVGKYDIFEDIFDENGKYKNYNVQYDENLNAIII